MNVSLQFLGAASEVTGSKYLLRIDEFVLLVDCGLFQGRKELRELNYDTWPIKAAEINAVILTHAHLDHTGYLPKLFRDGYRGPVYCTTATGELMKLILLDSAKIQEEEARYAKKKKYKESEETNPLYTSDDVHIIDDYLHGFGFGETFNISNNITATFYNAGHILGAAMIELILQGDKETKKIVFSGDLGRYNDPILNPPHILSEADILFVESTYGNQSITQTPREEIIQMMNEVFSQDGNLVVPAFAIGRTQNLLMYIKNVLVSGEIPPVTVVVDSPMAITATALYRKYQDYHKLRGIDLDEDESFMTLRKHLHISNSGEDSRRINDIKKDAIIIASGGMMTGGRVLHHLANRLPFSNNAVLISGYQSAGSHGRKLQQGAKTIRLFGQEVPVNARIATIAGLSAHADRDELLKWLSGFSKAPVKVFIVHGEPDSANALAKTLGERGWDPVVPVYKQEFEIFKNI